MIRMIRMALRRWMTWRGLGAEAGKTSNSNIEIRNKAQNSKDGKTNSKFERNFKIEMTKIRKKSFFETFDNIRRKKF
jgi:hypothetical protein